MNKNNNKNKNHIYRALGKPPYEYIENIKTFSFFDIATWGQPANGIVYHVDDINDSQHEDIKKWMSQTNNLMYHDEDRDELRIALPSDIYKMLYDIESDKIANSLKII